MDGEGTIQSRMLRFICQALDKHAEECGRKVACVWLHPKSFEILGWDEIRGIPIDSDSSVHPTSLQIECEGEADGIEDELERHLSPPKDRDAEFIAVPFVPPGIFPPEIFE